MTSVLIVTKEDFLSFMKQSRLDTFQFGEGRYDTETVCECLTCSVALRQIQVQKSVPIGLKRADGHAIKKGAARIESGAFNGCYICAPCKKALGSEILTLALASEQMNPTTMQEMLEGIRAKLFADTLMRMSAGDECKQKAIILAINENLLGKFSQSAGLPEYAYDFARLQRLSGITGGSNRDAD